MDALARVGGEAIAARLFALGVAGHRRGIPNMLRAGAAGAGAALVCEIARPLLRGRLGVGKLGPHSGDAMLAGAARGLAFATFVAPRIPGPALMAGALYGSVDFALSPWGGVTGVLGRRAPHRRVPLLASHFGDETLGEGSYLDHLTFGVLLAVLYSGAGGSSRGIPEER